VIGPMCKARMREVGVSVDVIQHGDTASGPIPLRSESWMTARGPACVARGEYLPAGLELSEVCAK
jgi:hypothetical protein